jgi:hypothetical protein
MRSCRLERCRDRAASIARVVSGVGTLVWR